MMFQPEGGAAEAPGDTVVIPLNFNKGKSLRLVVDLAQIVGQFGIAIAAANIVF